MKGDWFSKRKYPILDALEFMDKNRHLRFTRKPGGGDNLVVFPADAAEKHYDTMRDLKHAILWLIDYDNWQGYFLMDYIMEQLHKKVNHEYYEGARLRVAMERATAADTWVTELLDHDKINHAHKLHDRKAFVRHILDKHRQWKDAAARYSIPIEDTIDE